MDLTILPALFLMNQIDFKDPDNIFYVRVLFGVLQLAQLAVFLLVRTRIRTANLSTTIRIPVEASIENPKPDPNATLETTIADYDKIELFKAIRQVLIGSCITVGIHLYFSLPAPLFIQSFTIPANLYKNPLVQFYLFGKDTPRPFPKPENPIEKMTNPEKVKAEAEALQRLQQENQQAGQPEELLKLRKQRAAANKKMRKHAIEADDDDAEGFEEDQFEDGTLEGQSEEGEEEEEPEEEEEEEEEDKEKEEEKAEDAQKEEEEEDQQDSEPQQEQAKEQDLASERPVEEAKEDAKATAESSDSDFVVVERPSTEIQTETIDRAEPEAPKASSGKKAKKGTEPKTKAVESEPASTLHTLTPEVALEPTPEAVQPPASKQKGKKSKPQSAPEVESTAQAVADPKDEKVTEPEPTPEPIVATLVQEAEEPQSVVTPETVPETMEMGTSIQSDLESAPTDTIASTTGVATSASTATKRKKVRKDD
eukprot:TRINITY_DN1030_c0_g1_i1.p1 TRINITY_DN1030_c0_g1~~TRINITY_DN1030_c0_g1_i1.p1  ORF type:complete len:500 (-),score=160.44 TRINITY_DN1030_c0_g1_i1:35-1480(-)